MDGSCVRSGVIVPICGHGFQDPVHKTPRLHPRIYPRLWRGAIWRIRHHRADSVVWLSHMSSIWPWWGTAKARLYGTFIGGLWHAQHDPWYKITLDSLYSNELGRLYQGIGSGKAPNSKPVAGTNTFFCINFPDIPLHKRKEICRTMVVNKVQSDKDNPNRTLITIGGNRICYPGNVGTNKASLELLKLLLNSVLSWKGAHFSFINLKNFYLDTPMPEPEYVSWTSQTSSLMNTSSQVWTMMDGFTSKSARVAMACPKQAS